MAPELNAGHLILNLLKGRRDVCYLVVGEDWLHNSLILVFLNSIAHNAFHPESFLVVDKPIQCIFICTNVAHWDCDVSLNQVGGYRVLGSLGKFPSRETRFSADFGRVRPNQADKSQQPDYIRHNCCSQHGCQVSGC